MTDEIRTFTLKLDNGSANAVTKRLHQLGGSFSTLPAEEGFVYLRHDYEEPGIENFGLRLFGFISNDVGSDNYAIITDPELIAKIGCHPVTKYSDAAVAKILKFKMGRGKPANIDAESAAFLDCVIKTKDGEWLDVVAVAQTFISFYPTFTLVDTSDVYLYDSNEGIYKSAETKINMICQRYFSYFITLGKIREVIGHVSRLTYRDRKDVQEPTTKICLLNGILDLTTLTIGAFSPDFVFFSKIPVSYNPAADCPKIKKFLSEVVPADQVQVLQEISGYCLLKSYPIQKAILLIGEGSNGKSTFIKLLETFLGEDNHSSVPLQYLESNRFAAASLSGKLLNSFADMSDRALSGTGFFKMLTGGDSIPAERKFKNSFKFRNFAKMIFSCNRLPKSKDDSDAFCRRWVILVFPNKFINGSDNKNLLVELTTPEELSGFLNFAIEGLRRLLEQGDFSNAKSIEAVREEYIRMSDSVAAFVLDCVEFSSTGYISKKEIFANYTEYCRTMKYPIVSEAAFHSDLQKKIQIEDYRPSLEVDGKYRRVHCWRGIAIKTKVEKRVDILTMVDIAHENSHDSQDSQAFCYFSSSTDNQPNHSDTSIPEDTSPKEDVKDHYTSYTSYTERSEESVESVESEERKRISISIGNPLGRKGIGRSIGHKLSIPQDTSEDYLTHRRKVQTITNLIQGGLSDKEDITYEAANKEISIEETEAILSKLKDSGKIYEPRPGLILQTRYYGNDPMQTQQNPNNDQL